MNAQTIPTTATAVCPEARSGEHTWLSGSTSASCFHCREEIARETVQAEAGTFAGKTAAQWRAMAKDSRQSSADSWERSDTDGFLSQWASDTMARRYEHCAQVAEQDGMMLQVALFKDGELVKGARNVKGRYGYTWVFDGEDGRPVWLSESKAESAQKRRAYFVRKHEGYSIGWTLVEAGLDERSGKVFAKTRFGKVEVLTADDQDFTEDHNSAY